MTPSASNGQASGYGRATVDTLHAASTAKALEYEHKHAAHNYHPLPVVFAKAKGVRVWDPEGNEYLDFLSAYSAVNQGHCHPRIVDALIQQAQKLTLSSRAFHNDVFPTFAKFVTEFFGYDMVLPMNTGAEAVETGIKLARKWGYKIKKIPENKAIVLSVANNFHGRTFSALSMSTDSESRQNYGPYLPGVGPFCPATGKPIRFNHIEDLVQALETHGEYIAAFLVEPIQGEAGIIVPDDDYFMKVRELCTKHNVLLICDEIQTGIGRTGRLLCSEHYGIRPDVVLLGKAISGGIYPVSAVLADRDIMLCIEPGTHGSTYGGNPLGCAVAIAALEVVRDENLVAKAEILGKRFRDGLAEINSDAIKIIRGNGLLNAVVIDESKTYGHSAWNICIRLKAKGLLAKPTHQNIIRLAPPLVITEEEIDFAVQIFRDVLSQLVTWDEKDIPDEEKPHVNILDN